MTFMNRNTSTAIKVNSLFTKNVELLFNQKKTKFQIINSNLRIVIPFNSVM